MAEKVPILRTSCKKKNKLLILTSGDKSIRFRPHLTTNKEEIDAAISIIDVSIKKCLR